MPKPKHVWINLGGYGNEAFPWEHGQLQANLWPREEIKIATTILMDIFRALSPDLALAVWFPEFQVDAPEWTMSVIHVERVEQYGAFTTWIRRMLSLSPRMTRFDLFSLPTTSEKTAEALEELVDGGLYKMFCLDGITTSELPHYFDENDPSWCFSQDYHGWAFGCREDLKDTVKKAILESYARHGKKVRI
jgi:hypothetical protein